MIAIYDRKTDTIQQYTLQRCKKTSVIDYNYELIGQDDFTRIGIGALVHTRYVVSKTDLLKIILQMDHEAKDIPDDE